MSDFVTLQELWADLSAELWEQIFCCLERSIDFQSGGPWVETKEASYQACCCRYAHVCKKFRNVLLQHTHRTLRLRTHEENWSLLSLLDWIKKHASVEDLLLDISPDASVAVLSALYMSRCQLERVALTAASTIVTLIAAFSSIGFCVLRLTSMADTLSLQPLRALPSLETLRIGHGVFTDVAGAAAHLTELCFDQCLADCGTDCACVTSWVRLQLHTAIVKRFHTEGLAACSRLKVLQLTYAHLRQCGHAPDVDFGTAAVDSSALSKLSALTYLRVGPCGSSDKRVLPWLGGLPELRHLDITCAIGVVYLHNFDVYQPWHADGTARSGMFGLAKARCVRESDTVHRRCVIVFG